MIEVGVIAILLMTLVFKINQSRYYRRLRSYVSLKLCFVLFITKQLACAINKDVILYDILLAISELGVA